MKKHIIISTGGTGGHFFPALALAKSLSSKYKIVMLLDSRAYRSYKHNVPKNIVVYKISSKGLVSKNPLYILKMLFSLFIGFLQSIFLLRKYKVELVMSFGGYGGIPVGVAVCVLKVFSVLFKAPKLILHEQNAILGKANKLFVKRCDFLITSFKNTLGVKNNPKVKCLGLPIADEFYQSKVPSKIENSIALAIFGGSLGANIFGATIPTAFLKLSQNQQSKFTVYHQCRENNLKEVQSLWGKSAVNVKWQPFFNNVVDIIREVDIIICRSGASTVFELNAMGKYAVYVPFKYAAENHQFYNAQSAVQNHGATMILEEDFSESTLSNILGDILNNKELFYSKKEHCYELKDNNNAKEMIVSLINSTI